MYCENCGNKIQPDDKFCESCGANLQLKIPVPSASNHRYSTNNKSSNSKKLILISTITVFVLASAAAAFFLLYYLPNQENNPSALESQTVSDSQSVAPNDDNLLEQAQNFINNNKFQEAIDLYNEYLKQNPDDIEVLFALASSHEALGNITDAIETYSKILELQLDNINAILNLALVYQEVEDYANAEIQFLRYIEIDDTNEEVFLIYADMFTQINEFEKAKDIIELIPSEFKTSSTVLALEHIKILEREKLEDSYFSLDINDSVVSEAIQYLTSLNNSVVFQGNVPLLAPFEDPKDIDPRFAIWSTDVYGLEQPDDFFYPLDVIVEQIKEDLNPDFEIPEDYDMSKTYSYVMQWSEKENGYYIYPTGGSTRYSMTDVVAAYYDSEDNLVIDVLEYQLERDSGYMSTYASITIDNMPVGHINSMMDMYSPNGYSESEVWIKDTSTLPQSRYILRPTSDGGFNILSKIDLSKIDDDKVIVNPIDDYPIVWENEAIEIETRYLLDKYEEDIMYSDVLEIDRMSLYLFDYKNLNDLAHFKNLENLSITYSDITDISALSELENLIMLDLSANLISDLSPLSNLTNLRSLNLSNNKITDISPLFSLNELNYLNLHNFSMLYNEDREGNQVSDITGIENLAGLVYLNVAYNEIQDLSPLEGHQNLNRLDLYLNNITDISILPSIPKLTYVSLGGNEITDYSPSDDIDMVIEIPDNY